VTSSGSGAIGLPARPSAACSRRIAGFSPSTARITSRRTSTRSSCGGEALADDRIPCISLNGYDTNFDIDYNMHVCYPGQASLVRAVF
jgi:hypothetical protein